MAMYAQLGLKAFSFKLLITEKKKKRSYYSVSNWAWKTFVVFGDPDLIVP